MLSSTARKIKPKRSSHKDSKGSNVDEDMVLVLMPRKDAYEKIKEWHGQEKHYDGGAEQPARLVPHINHNHPMSSSCSRNFKAA